MTEEWRNVVGFAGLYDISSYGRVWSHVTKKILRPGVASSGYPTVALGRGNTRTLHSLVADAFLGPRPEGCEVRHRDGNRANAFLYNLNYGSRSDNIGDAVRHGTWRGARRTELARSYIFAEHRAKAWATRRARYGARGRS